MKGNVKITVVIRDEIGQFPITETYTFSRDNTFESVVDWILVFSKILVCAGFNQETIDRVLVTDAYDG